MIRYSESWTLWLSCIFHQYCMDISNTHISSCCVVWYDTFKDTWQNRGSRNLHAIKLFIQKHRRQLSAIIKLHQALRISKLWPSFWKESPFSLLPFSVLPLPLSLSLVHTFIRNHKRTALAPDICQAKRGWFFFLLALLCPMNFNAQLPFSYLTFWDTNPVTALT